MRLNRRAEEIVLQVFGSVQAFEEHLNENPGFFFQQREERRINGQTVAFRPSTILLSGNVKLVLSPPVITRDGYYNRIITVLSPNRNDRADALSGNEVKEPIEIEPDIPDRLSGPRTPPATAVKKTEEQAQETAVTEKEKAGADEKPAKPTPVQDEDRQNFLITPLCPKCSGVLVPERGMFCAHCGDRLSDALAVHKELVVSIDVKKYDELAVYLKQQLNTAWSQLTRGRKVQKVSSLACNVFLLTIEDEMRTSTLIEEKRFEDLLTETGVGTTSDDRYEIGQAHTILASKHPKKAD
jgi:hypothetical protein